jgi:hypothetical protein
VEWTENAPKTKNSYWDECWQFVPHTTIFILNFHTVFTFPLTYTLKSVKTLKDKFSIFPHYVLNELLYGVKLGYSDFRHCGLRYLRKLKIILRFQKWLDLGPIYFGKQVSHNDLIDHHLKTGNKPIISHR